MGYILLNKPKKPSYKRSFDKVEDVLEHKPETWLRYEHEPHGLQKIVEMEFGEFMERKDDRTYKETLVALEHLAAASLYALHRMTGE